MRWLSAALLPLLCTCATPKKDVPLPLIPLPQLTSPGVRLPPGARPTSYRLEVTLVPGQERFTGRITASVDVTRPLAALWLNARGLTVEKTSLRTEHGLRDADVVVVDDHFIALVPRCTVAQTTCLVSPGEQDVELAFSGPLSKQDTDGIFQVKEGDDWYAYTSFEPIDARRAFPHFDEPQFKVPWEVSLVVKEQHVALANTPERAVEKLPGGLKRVRFARSQPMSSYLVAFAAGPFELVDAGQHGQKKTPVRIVVPKGKAGEAAYAAATTGVVLSRLEAWFGTPYPFEKLDQLAVQANMGAMENPGLVTYGHQLLLSRPEVDNLTRQRGFASVCTHELAHQWFGDLVTMSWWDDLWLNEAFATWMTPRILEDWQPTWAMDVQQVQRRNGALGADALVNARQIRQPIASNDDIANAFDGITYGKGASVIGMFEAWVGRETFQKGVRAYLEKHAWKNATAADFLSALSAAAGKDVEAPFRTFLDQPGAPTIDFALSCPPKRPPVLALSQKRALPVGSTGDAARTWKLPVCVRYQVKGEQARACTLLEEGQGRLVLEGAKACPDWVLPNDRGDGYYRARLSGPMSLVDVYKKAGSKLTVPERVGVLGDVAALVRSGDLDLSVMLELAPLVAKESDRHLLGFALSFASSAGSDLLPEPIRPHHEAFVRSLFSARLDALGFEPKPGEDEDTRLFRPQVIGTLGWTGRDPKVLSTARALTERWLTDKKAIHPDVLDVVLALAGEASDEALHDKLLAAARQERDRAERGRLLGALAETSDRGQVEKHLPLVLTDAFEMREAMRFVWGAAGDYRTRDLALAFVQQHWDAIVPRLPQDGAASLVWLAGGVCTAPERDAARAFFDGRSTKYLGGPRSFALAMESVELCLAYRARHRPSAVAFFEKAR
ncbi:MAG: ERAP1-like C-terminal domain-containing protein [Myxococcaceae bacterium]|nr:ERAP1-like C-terminal domain-containing protein [Myxococcaceae bacterium]